MMMVMMIVMIVCCTLKKHSSLLFYLVLFHQLLAILNNIDRLKVHLNPFSLFMYYGHLVEYARLFFHLGKGLIMLGLHANVIYSFADGLHV